VICGDFNVPGFVHLTHLQQVLQHWTSVHVTNETHDVLVIQWLEDIGREKNNYYSYMLRGIEVG